MADLRTHPAPTTPSAVEHVDLLVGGMTCASCVARVEKKLNRLDGVTATVNLATASASVDYDPGETDVDRLLRDRRAHRLHRRRGHRRVGRRGRGRRAGARRRLPPPAAGRRAADGRSCWSWRCCPASRTPAAALAGLSCSRPRSCCGPAGRSTGPQRSTPGTGPAPWTRWSRSAPWSPTVVVVQVAQRGHAQLRRGRRDRDHVPAARPLARGPGEARARVGPARAARARRQRGDRCSRTTAPSASSTSAACARGCASWCGPASRSPPTAWSSRAAPAVDESMLTGESVPVDKSAR